MFKIYLIGSIITTLVSCDYGPKATLNNDFVAYPSNKSINLKKLAGTYELDDISKRKYNIESNQNLLIQINADSSFLANKYIDNITGKAIEQKKNGHIYIHNPQNSTDNYFIELNELNAKTTQLYFRKKDSAIALYVLTPFIPASKENNFQYKDADYLRYIQVKKQK
ncbi:MAG: hypothetical protein E2590_16665 [Chryseobacterium sp.]|nr:hypothetical protein [Chryseobacterium sp.]